MMENSPSKKQEPVKVQDFDVSTPLDMKRAIECLGMPENYFKMLNIYIDSPDFISRVESLGKAVNDRDTYNMKFNAHSIKGSCAYVGASRLHYATYYIQSKYQSNSEDYEGMVEYYPLVVETAIEFRVYAKMILSKYNQQEFILNESDQVMPLADNY